DRPSYRSVRQAPDQRGRAESTRPSDQVDSHSLAPLLPRPHRVHRRHRLAEGKAPHSKRKFGYWRLGGQSGYAEFRPADPYKSDNESRHRNTRSGRRHSAAEFQDSYGTNDDIARAVRLLRLESASAPERDPVSSGDGRFA